MYHVPGEKRKYRLKYKRRGENYLTLEVKSETQTLY